MKSSKASLIWLNYLTRGALGGRRFIGVTPPWVHRQRVYDRVKKQWLTFNIRDDDDWIQVEHIFLNEEFDLAATGRSTEIEHHYNALLTSGKTPLIVDLGANIGLASRYFHERYPKADLISVEPDAGNCAIARSNLPASAMLIEAAISSHAGRAGLINTGRNCGFRVDMSRKDEIPGNDEILLITVPDILEQAGDRVPFIVKIDIEGFEEDLFESNTDWIDQFPVLLIELHDWMLPGRRVTKNFISEMARRDREFIHFNGYVVSLGLL